MSATFLHVGIPVTTKKPGMTYAEGIKTWMTNPDDDDYKIEYLKFEEGGPFPEIMHKNPHVAYKVDNLELHLKDATQVIVEPMAISSTTRIAFIIKDDVLVELLEEK